MTFIRMRWSQIKFGLLIVCVIGGILAFWFSRPKEEPAVEWQTFSSESQEALESVTELDSGVIYVDLKGAVYQPGMYQLTKGARLLDLVQVGGGFLDNADQNQVNLALLLEDQQVIYIPKVGEELALLEASQTQSQGQSEVSEKININTASQAELETLSGIGPKKAQKIIAFREEQGSFKSIEDLKNVSGFGEKSVAALAEEITVE